MLDFNVIKLLLKKILYEKYYPLAIGLISNPDTKRVAYSLKSLHKGNEEYSVDDLELSFYLDYPALRQSEKDLFGLLFKRIRETECNEELLEQYLKQLKQRSKAHEIAVVAIEVEEGRKDVETLVEQLKHLDVDEPLEEDVELVTTSLKELMREEEELPGLSWRLKCLNVSIGSIRKGNLIHIFARVETGKTAMWVSELTHMVSQIPEDKTALIFFNEEGGRDVVYRLYSAMLRKSYRELLYNPEESERLFNELGGSKIRFVDRPTLTKKEIEEVCKKMNPALIVIDNLDKVKGFEADRKDLELAAIYKWARELSKMYCPIITVGQADATAHNRKYLDEAQMADSKTGKPAELDVIIGIGRTDADGMGSIRHISIPKNKLRGSKESIESYRHSQHDVIIHHELSLYEDVIDDYRN